MSKANIGDFRKGSRVVRGEDYRPGVSVIIPTYNRARFIERAIRSVLNQTYQNFEIIVVDDASTDDTEERVRRLLTNGTRFKYVRHDINRGAGAARNTGIKNAAGEYIALLDSDDEWLPEKLEKQLQVFKEARDEKLGAVYSGVVYIKEKDNQKIDEHMPKRRGYIFKDFLRRCCIHGGPGVFLIRKEVFDKCGLFDECGELRIADDYEMWVRISKDYKFDFVNAILTRCYRHDVSITAAMTEYDRAIADEYVVNKFREDYERVPKILSLKLCGIASLYCRGGDVNKGRKMFLESIGANPLNIRNYPNLFLSYFGSSFYRKIFNFSLIFRKGFSYTRRRNDMHRGF